MSAALERHFEIIRARNINARERSNTPNRFIPLDPSEITIRRWHPQVDQEYFDIPLSLPFRYLLPGDGNEFQTPHPGLRVTGSNGLMIACLNGEKAAEISFVTDSPCKETGRNLSDLTSKMTSMEAVTAGNNYGVLTPCTFEGFGLEGWKLSPIPELMRVNNVSSTISPYLRSAFVNLANRIETATNLAEFHQAFQPKPEVVVVQTRMPAFATKARSHQLMFA